MSSSEKPLYTHDCDTCQFLGSYTSLMHPGDRQVMVFDLYVCKNTVIARYGNEGSEYASGLPFAKQGSNFPLVEALRRATLAGIEIDE